MPSIYTRNKPLIACSASVDMKHVSHQISVTAPRRLEGVAKGACYPLRSAYFFLSADLL